MRFLLEQVQVIVTQLKEKGEEINSTWLIKKVLAKFPDFVKRKAITKKQNQQPDVPFDMETLLTYINEILSTEEMFALFSNEDSRTHRKSPIVTKQSQGWQPSCMYCQQGHSSNRCMKYPTAQERSLYLRKNSLCLICASSEHNTASCRGRPCFRCKGLQHTPCCFKQDANKKLPPQRQDYDSASARAIRTNAESKQDNRRAPRRDITRIPKTTPAKVRSHVVVTNEESLDQTGEEPQLVLSSHLSNRPSLPTGEVTILDPGTKTLSKVDVLLDTGAEASFVDSAFAQKLELPILEEKQIMLRTFGSNESKAKRCKLVSIEVWDNDGMPHSLELLTSNILTSSFTPPRIPNSDHDFIRSLDLSISLSKNKEVIIPKILLGCDQLWSFVRNDAPLISLPSGLHLLPTKLGHLVSGKITNADLESHQVSQINHDDVQHWEKCWSMGTIQVNTVTPTESEISSEEREQWEKFWTLETAGTEEFTGSEKEAREALDRKVWQEFKDSIQKREDGYYVRLPWRDHYSTLPDNRAIAYKRLVSVWNSLSKDEELLDQYNNTFQDQLRNNIIEYVEETAPSQGGQIHYIPHQPVLTPHKTTTKLRIVFDASAHYKDSPSLNDVLYKGPVTLPSLYGILLRFRIRKIAITSDVEKAFLQVRLQEQDRDATRCLWLRDHKLPPTSSNIQVFRFTRVTFGLKSSPFLLAGTTLYHLENYEEESSMVQEIKRNLYVDNLLQTADTLEEAKQLYYRSKQIFEDLKMNLREFSSNNSPLMEVVKDQDKSVQQYPKVLGLTWNVRGDTVDMSLQLPRAPITTKRSVTSAIASIYDPLGWMVPLLHNAKIFLQHLWQQQHDWDTILPTELEDEWNHLVEQIQGFAFNIPRFLAPKGGDGILITFVDASTSAIAACTYLFHEGRAQLVMAKPKLPPLQGQYTIPKLELNAFTLGSRLTHSVLSELEPVLNIRSIYLFSDSEIVLNWLKLKPEKKVGQFVYNRLIEISNISKNIGKRGCSVRYGYVASCDNPADCGTRGLTKVELENHIWWWIGPLFLQSNPIRWPVHSRIFDYTARSDNSPDPADCFEGASALTNKPTNKKTSRTLKQDQNELLGISQVRTFSKAKRIIAHVLRFLFATITRVNHKRYANNNIVLSTMKELSPSVLSQSLTGGEIALARELIIRRHQEAKVSKQIIQSLHNLNIRPDAHGILRCYGRLGKAQLDDSAKYPIFILQKTLLAEIIIRDIHEKGHPGINHTIALVRQQYWIPQLRSQVLSITRKCFHCQRFNNLPYKYPRQEDLPKERVVRSHPFQHVGLDYFGPLSIRSSSGNQEKCYGAIITCMTTRLVHLDVVADFTSVAFLNMLRRFFARRGVPRSITSDNAPTFELGEAILNESIKAARSDPAISKTLSDREVDWRHITPHAPWQGGFYERLIKSVKHSLHKTLGKKLLSLEEMTTVLTEIEALINTRPLTHMSNDFNDDQALRPIDFVQRDLQVHYPLGVKSPASDDPDYLPSEIEAVLQTRNQALTALETSCKHTEKFWKVWQTQYLTALREKHTVQIGQKKGCVQTPHEGAVVLLCDPIQPRHCWKMGIINKVVVNNNGTIREAVVRLSSQRLIRRPINLLVPLELDQEDGNGDETQELPGSSQQKNSEVTLLPSRSSRDATDPQEQVTSPEYQRYNFRKRRRINYKESSEESGDSDEGSTPTRTTFNISTLFQISLVLSVMVEATEVMAQNSSLHSIQCFPGGVALSSPALVPYEICAEHYCVQVENPRMQERINLPPDVILHEHLIQWKLEDGRSINTIETVCPPGPFCESITCTFCSANIFNPECWPKSAISATSVLIYLLVIGCYVFLYVPVVIGLPIRVAFKLLWTACRMVLRGCQRLGNTRRSEFSFRRRHLAEIIALATTISCSLQCQEVNLFTQYATICTRNTQEPCQVQVSEVIKINPFKRNACLRLLQNTTSVHEIHLQWKSLKLLCEPETDMFTRDAVQKVTDSKRCSHSGSGGDKCGSINKSSLIPELKEGNQYPGNTFCVESCGGPGCDCFYLSSGCLFYRIYAQPIDDEIFHCNRWRESASVEYRPLRRNQEEKLYL